MQILQLANLIINRDTEEWFVSYWWKYLSEVLLQKQVSRAGTSNDIHLQVLIIHPF